MLLLVDQRGDCSIKRGFIDLIRDLGDDDRFAIFADLLGRRLGAQLQTAAASGVVHRRMPWRPRINPPVGKSGPCTISRIFASGVSRIR